MNGTASLLPEGYEMLEPFVADWALPAQSERARRRSESTAEQKHVFYNAARGVAAQALGELDTKPLDQLDERERRLLALLLSYAQVALSIEVRGEGEAIHAKDRRLMTITRQQSWT